MASLVRNNVRVLSKLAPRVLSQSKSYHTSIGRNVSNLLLSRSQQNRVPLFLQRHLSASAAVAEQLSTEETTSKEVFHRRSQVKVNRIEEQLVSLVSAATDVGRISPLRVNYILKMIETTKEVSAREGMLLLQFLGDIMAECHPQVRLEMTHRVWETLNKLKMPLEKTHYNTLMRIYMENGYKFKPEEILAEMEAKGLKPNRVTYQRFIAQYCEIGDIEGASQVLEHMKNQGLSINETTFHSFIVGHMRANEIEKAKAVLESMSNAGLEPNLNTYKVLMCAYADMGNIEGVKEVLMEAEENNLVVQASTLLSVLLSFVKHGHFKYADEMIELVDLKPKPIGYSHDRNNTCVQLIAYGQEDLALKLSRKRREAQSDADTRLAANNNGKMFVWCMINNNRPMEKLVEIVKRMNKEDSSLIRLEDMVEQAYQYNQYDSALTLLRVMSDLGQQPRAHYFWPLFRGLGNDRNIDGVYEAVSHFISVVSGQGRIGETFSSYIIPELSNCGQDINDVSVGLQKAGVNEEDANAYCFNYLLDEESVEAALEFGQSKNNVKILPLSLKGIFSRGQNRHIRWETALKAMKTFKQLNGTSVGHIFMNGVLLENWIDSWLKTENLSEIDNILRQMQDENLAINKKTGENIIDKLKRHEVSEESLTMLNSLIGLSRGREEFFQERMDYDDESQHIDNKIRNKQNNAKSLDELLKDLESRGIESSAWRLRSIGQAAIDEGHLELALEYIGKLKSRYPEYKKYSLLNWCCVKELITSGKTNEGVALMRDFGGSDTDRKDGYMFSAFKEILHHCSKEGYGQLEDVYSFLVDNVNLDNRDQRDLALHFVDLSIENGEPDDVLKAVEFCMQKGHNSVLHRALQKFIQTEDVDRLQQVVDIYKKAHGVANTALALSSAFIEQGQHKQASKLLMTYNVTLPLERLKQQLSYFARVEKKSELEQLVDLTKNQKPADRLQILSHYIDLCCEHKMWSEALGVLEKFEEENLFPPEEIFLKLGESLLEDNQEVPFAMPVRKHGLGESLLEDNIEDNNKNKNSVRQQMSPALKAVTEQDTDALLVAKEKATKDGIQDNEFYTSLHSLCRTLKDGNFLREHLGQLGEVEVMLQLVEEMGPPTRSGISKTSSAIKNLVTAFIKSERTSEMEKWISDNEEKIIASVGYPRGLLNELHENQPNICLQVEEMLKKSPYYFTLTDLFSHHIFTSKNIDKARQIIQILFEKYRSKMEQDAQDNVKSEPAKMQKKLHGTITKLAFEGQVDVLEQVLQTGYEQMPESAPLCGKICGDIVEVYCREGDWQKAQQTLEDSTTKGLKRSSIRAKSLFTLQKLLEENGQPNAYLNIEEALV